MKKILLFLITATITFASIKVEYTDRYEKIDKKSREWVIKNELFKGPIDLINSEIDIQEEVVVVVGDEEDPYYDPELKKIFIPYGFITEVRSRFKADGDEKWEVYSRDALIHTIYHELGHALIDIKDIPVLGREEDAVDDFATIILILTEDKGWDMAISAAELYFMEGEDIEEYTMEDLSDEHLLDDQRGYRGLCLVYGSNPSKFDDIAKDLNMDEDMKEMCKDLFYEKTYSWLILLKSSLKKGILLEELDELLKSGE